MTRFWAGLFTRLPEHTQFPPLWALKKIFPVVVAGALRELPHHGLPLAPRAGVAVLVTWIVPSAPATLPAGPWGTRGVGLIVNRAVLMAVVTVAGGLLTSLAVLAWLFQ